MRIIQARCEVVYEGRCMTFLPPAERLVIMKDDDTVLIHGNTGMKPINYMPKVTGIEHTMERTNDGIATLPTMVVTNLHESLHIRMYEIVRDDTYEFPEGTGGLEELQKRQSEDELQGWLADNFNTVFDGYDVRFVCREFETGKGPVDLLGTSSKDGSIALIEVKRHAKLKDVYQVLRYKHAAGEQYALLTAQGVDEFPAYSRKTSIATGSLPKHDAVMLPTSALRKPLLFLVAESFTNGADTECEKNGVIAITTHALGIGEDCPLGDEGTEQASEQPEREDDDYAPKEHLEQKPSDLHGDVGNQPDGCEDDEKGKECGQHFSDLSVSNP